MKLANFIGNEKIVNRLGDMIKAKRFPQAILLEGEEGIGKKTLAKDLATALVCKGENKPCLNCSQCRKASVGAHLDIRVDIPSGKANSFYVDTVRDIINDAYIQPNEADYKIYILANVQCMNQNAQNALLKILEEPPQYAIFILTVNSKSTLLPTILSRCVSFTLEGVNSDSAAEYIVSHIDGVDYNSARKTVDVFDGNIGKAIGALQDKKTSEMVEFSGKLCRCVADGNEYDLIKLCSAFNKDRQGVIFACSVMKNVFRDALISVNSGDYMSGQKELADYLNTKLTKKSLVNLIEVCDSINEYAQANANATLLVTKFCYELRRAIGR